MLSYACNVLTLHACVNVLASYTYNRARTNEACKTPSRLNMHLLQRKHTFEHHHCVCITNTSVRSIILLASQVLQKSLAYDTVSAEARIALLTCAFDRSASSHMHEHTEPTHNSRVCHCPRTRASPVCTCAHAFVCSYTCLYAYRRLHLHGQLGLRAYTKYYESSRYTQASACLHQIL